MTDSQLDALLSAAALARSCPPQPDLTRRVWREIESRQSAPQGWLERLSAFFALLTLPKPRLALWAVALASGILLGIRAPSRPADPLTLYARSIHPAAPATAHAP